MSFDNDPELIVLREAVKNLYRCTPNILKKEVKEGLQSAVEALIAKSEAMPETKVAETASTPSLGLEQERAAHQKHRAGLKRALGQYKVE